MGIFTAILSIFGPVLTFLSKMIIEKLFTKGEMEIANAKKEKQIADFKENCLRAVKSVDISYSLPLKQQNGKLTPEQAAQAKKLAIDEVKAHYGKEQLVDLAMLFSVDAEGLVRLIGETIEAAILINKKADSIALEGEIDKLPTAFKK